MVSYELIPVMRRKHRLLPKFAQVAPACPHSGVEHSTDRLRVVSTGAAHFDIQ